MDILGLFDGFVSFFSSAISSGNNNHDLDGMDEKSIKKESKEELIKERMEELKRAREKGNKEDKSNDFNRNY